MATQDNQAPLLAAVRRRDRKAVRDLLAAGFEVDPVFTPPVEGKTAPFLAGYTPLMIAAVDGEADLVRVLLAAGADVNAVVDGARVRAATRADVKVLEEGRSGLMLAADAGEREIVEILLEAGADVRIQGSAGETALSLALQKGNDEIAELLRFAGAGGEGGKSTDAELIRAVERRDAAAVQTALGAGADPDAAAKNAVLGRTPALVLAARSGDREIIEALLAAGANVDAREENPQPPTGKTALLVAAEAGHAEVIRSLLRAGAEPELKDESFVEGTIGNTTVAWSDMPRCATALILAAERGHTEAVQTLLEEGANVNGRGSGAYPTPLLAAIEGQQLAVVQILLQAGANVESGTPDETPLSLAVANGSREIVELLLSAGADPNQRSEAGLTPLEIARLSKFDDLVERLTQAGARG